MEKTIIRNVEPIKGISRIEFYKRVKQAINSDSYADTERFINETKFKMEIEVNSNIVPHLKSAFTFQIKSEEELERENYYKERDEKIQKAKSWFDTLTQEQKEFASLLFIPTAG
jgi:hypothetical protein